MTTEAQRVIDELLAQFDKITVKLPYGITKKTTTRLEENGIKATVYVQWSIHGDGAGADIIVTTHTEVSYK